MNVPPLYFRMNFLNAKSAYFFGRKAIIFPFNMATAKDVGLHDIKATGDSIARMFGVVKTEKFKIFARLTDCCLKSRGIQALDCRHDFGWHGMPSD